jgi:hypothetical protein
MNTSALIAAARFHSLAACAAAHGGFWVSAGGGTANVVAGEIARVTGVTFEDAHHALDITGREAWGDDWYGAIAAAQPFGYGVIPFDDEREEWYCRWGARTIARAACRPVRVVQ